MGGNSDLVTECWTLNTGVLCTMDAVDFAEFGLWRVDFKVCTI